jgi:peroxin-11B
VRESQRLWLSGIIFSLFHSALQWRQLSQRERKVVKTEAEGRLTGETLKKEREAVKTQLVMDACDFLIPATALGYLELDDGVVGAAGVVSSWIGLKAQWAKTA